MGAKSKSKSANTTTTSTITNNLGMDGVEGITMLDSDGSTVNVMDGGAFEFASNSLRGLLDHSSDSLRGLLDHAEDGNSRAWQFGGDAFEFVSDSLKMSERQSQQSLNQIGKTFNKSIDNIVTANQTESGNVLAMAGKLAMWGLGAWAVVNVAKAVK